MSKLTVNKMDRINFLLTEVSLECLGNKYYDIYGDPASSLVYLVSTNSLKAKPTNNDSNKRLFKTLEINPSEYEESGVVTKSLQRKRRASLSDKDFQIDNDPESLLVPMEKTSASKAAKISRRRSTITASQMQKVRKLNQTSEAPQNKLHDLSDIKNNLKRDIELSECFYNPIFK